MFDVRSVFAAFRGRRAAARTSYGRGEAALDAGRLAEALREFEAAHGEAASSAQRAHADNKRGVVLMALGRASEALVAFTDALASDERHAAALVNVGNLLLEGGHPFDALDYYRAAVRCDETYTLAHVGLGVALKRLGRRGEAVRSLRTAARLEGRRRRHV